MRYKEDNQLNKHLGKTPFLSLPFTPDTSPPLLSLSPLPWLSPQVPLCPWGETVLVQELGVGARRFLSAAPSSSFLLLPRGPLHGPQAPQGCACPTVGTFRGCSPLRGVPALVWRASFQECISSRVPSNAPFPMPPAVSFLACCHTPPLVLPVVLSATGSILLS